jgi:radical SAM protein with 4Fe4S-binding SPASM domain
MRNSKQGKQGGEKINMNLLKSTIDELSPTLGQAILYFQGEPLLNKDFTEIVRYIHDKKILTSTSTNAQLLSDETAKKIVLSGLDRIIISIDGTTQETYESYRVGAKLDKTIQGIQNLVKWKRELNSKSPFIELQFLVLSTNEHQMKAMKKMAKQWQADKLTFKTAQLYDFENGNPLLPKNKKYARYELRSDGKYHIKSSFKNRCKRLWSGCVITSEGNVLPCCFDKDNSYVFGNLFQDNFRKIWHNQKANAFRQNLLQNRKQFEMCRNCTEP